MEIVVTNRDGAMSAVSNQGHKLSIMIGPNKPADDDSMNSFEVFMTSLGFCIAAMLGNYSDKAGLEISAIEVAVTAKHKKEAGSLSKVHVAVSIPGQWDDRRKRAFHKVADACPVHESILNWEGVEIVIE